MKTKEEKGQSVKMSLKQLCVFRYWHFELQHFGPVGLSLIDTVKSGVTHKPKECLIFLNSSLFYNNDKRLSEHEITDQSAVRYRRTAKKKIEVKLNLNSARCGVVD